MGRHWLREADAGRFTGFRCRPGHRHDVAVSANRIKLVVLLLSFVAAGISAAAAQKNEAPGIGPTVPAKPAQPNAAAVYNVFKKACARCHQAGVMQADAPSNGIDNILNLPELARDVALVRPGHPDASPLYNSILTLRMPFDVYPDRSGHHIPTASEISAVRSWIRSLKPAGTSTCTQKATIDFDTIAQTIDAHLEKLHLGAASHVRFVELSAFHNACEGERPLSRYRTGARALLTALSHSARPVTARAVGANGLLLAVSLEDLGWTEAHWDRLTARLPVHLRQLTSDSVQNPLLRLVLPAGWLADMALRLATHENLTGAQSSGRSIDQRLAAKHKRLVHRLAWRYRAPLDLTRAAAEWGSDPATFLNRLEVYSGSHIALARRLRQGLVTRAEFDRLSADLARPAATTPSAPSPDDVKPRQTHTGQFSEATQPGSAVTQKSDRDRLKSRPPVSADPLAQLGLSVWTHKPSYKRGELLKVYARSDTACHLTIIAIDVGGHATVLFPNETAVDNRIPAFHTIEIPHKDAPHVFRLTEVGEEKIVAICMPDLRTPPGITRRYERQRFTILGDWERFLHKSLEAEERLRKNAARQSTKRSKKKRRRRHRRRNRNEPETPYRSDGRPEPQARTAIVVRID